MLKIMENWKILDFVVSENLNMKGIIWRRIPDSSRPQQDIGVPQLINGLTGSSSTLISSILNSFAPPLPKKTIIKKQQYPDCPLKESVPRLCNSFVNIANYTSLSSIEIIISQEIKCKWQNQSFMSNKFVTKHYIKSYRQEERSLENSVRLTSFQKPQLQSVSIFFKFCPSMPPFVYLLCYLYLLYCFERWFLCFTQFSGGFYCLNFDNFVRTWVSVEGQVTTERSSPAGNWGC